jgi:ATP-dependent DNA helicase RecG
MDGKLPADVDVYSVSSVRRNPIIADLFQRMGFMERRGSGLRKIREETSWCANYRDEFKPEFRDDGHSFTVVLWDMNYDAGQSTGKVSANVSGKVNESVSANIGLVVELLEDSELSARELMGKLGMVNREHFIRAYLRPAMDAGLIERTVPEKPNSRLQKYRRKS